MEVIELDGVPLKFVKLKLADEDDWKAWLRALILADAVRDAEALGLMGKDKLEFLAIKSDHCAAGKCGLLTELGMQHATTPDGIRQLLRMASRENHPSPAIDDETLSRLLVERTDDVRRVIEFILPGKREKKANGGLTAIPPGTPKSSAAS